MTSDRTRMNVLVKAIFAVLVWGASFIATKLSLRETTPVVVIWLRFGIGVFVLGAFVAARREFTLPARRELGIFAFLGFLGITFHQWLQVTGLLTAAASTTAWIITTIPIFIALLARITLGEKLGARRVGGIALASAGVLLIVARGDTGSLLHGQFGTEGDFLVLLSAVNWAVFTVMSRRVLQSHSATYMLFFVMLFGWIFTSFWLAATNDFGSIANLTVRGWTSILFLGIACSGFAYIFWYDALKMMNASQVGSLLYLEPVVAVIVAALVLDEPLSIALFAGGAAIITGVWMVNRTAVSQPTPD